MKKYIVSNRAVASNQANARKSTGPRTDRGKAIVRLNLLRATLLSRVSLVTAGDCREDTATFARLLESLRADLQPEGSLEETLVDRIVQSLWRMRRAQQYETGRIRQRLDELNAPPELHAAQLRPADDGEAAARRRPHGAIAVSDARTRPNPRHSAIDPVPELATAGEVSAALERARLQRTQIADVLSRIVRGTINLDDLDEFFDAVQVLNQVAAALGAPAHSAQAPSPSAGLRYVMQRLPRHGETAAETPANAPSPPDTHALILECAHEERRRFLEGLEAALPEKPANTAVDANAPSESVSCPWTRVRQACRDFSGQILAEYDGAIRRFEHRLRGAQRYDRLRAHRHRMACQLPADADFSRFIRYESLLDREFHRALRELRQTQATRHALAQSPERARGR